MSLMIRSEVVANLSPKRDYFVDVRFSLGVLRLMHCQVNANVV